MSQFDAVATDYDAYRPEYPSELFDTIERYAGALHAMRVLDLAAGTGIATRALTARGATVVATDLGEDMVRVLRHRSPDVPAVIARAESLPFPDEVYGLVTCATAWHWIEPDRGPAEAFRVLQPGGTLAVWWAVGGIASSDDAAAADRERAVYAKWKVGERGPLASAANQTDPAEHLPTRGYVDVTHNEFTLSRVMSPQDHVSHLLTHSSVFALGDDMAGLRADLLEGYADSDTVTEAVWYRVTLARKP
jgi:SAM-dependent methyltransferase